MIYHPTDVKYHSRYSEITQDQMFEKGKIVQLSLRLWRKKSSDIIRKVEKSIIIWGRNMGNNTFYQILDFIETYGEQFTPYGPLLYPSGNDSQSTLWAYIVPFVGSPSSLNLLVGI